MRSARHIALAAILLLLALTSWIYLSRQQPAFDVAPGYRVLTTAFVTGKENAFSYTLPTLGRDFTAYCETIAPTNVLWILIERPTTAPHILRWTYTNTAGLSISTQPSSAWFDKGLNHVGFGTNTISIPVPLPDRDTIQNQIVSFEQENGTPLFKVKIP